MSSLTRTQKVLSIIGVIILVVTPANLIGWVGAVLFALSAAPQAYKSYRDGHSRGLSDGLLQMWLWGEVFSLRAVLSEPAPLWYVVFNYAINLIFLLIIVYYKLYPREDKNES